MGQGRSWLSCALDYTTNQGSRLALIVKGFQDEVELQTAEQAAAEEEECVVAEQAAVVVAAAAVVEVENFFK